MEKITNHLTAGVSIASDKVMKGNFTVLKPVCLSIHLFFSGNHFDFLKHESDNTLLSNQRKLHVASFDTNTPS